jgi:Rrf2 family nitric oxide-sensitive transcriptional repressor
MRLSLQTDYALRTLMYLGGRAERATIHEVADFYRISAAHVAKAVNLLARFGYIRSLRGIGGGIELARQPDAIHLGEVIRAFEGNMHLLECVGCAGVCTIEDFCRLKGVLAGAERVQMDYLNSVTLRDVLPTRRQLTRPADPATSIPG